ncbi:MAG: glucose-1-phosphate adenylyltransferase subunit GlgD [Clostridiales bacterium]|jgi:glucose-1-phosphate adenylyltransferase|nr:glucose-1-phosphate adenylyltransferase subunit GlgD [Clostridiales bacterium]
MKAIGVILAGGNNERLDKLTEKRASSAMPVGSCYRALDFPLSNMSNSGVGKVAVITQYNSRSLHDHASSSKWWDLGRKQGGLFIFSPYLSSHNNLWFRGTADSLYQNLTYLERSKEPYVIIASGNGVYKFDYNDLIAYHERKDAEVTIAYKLAREGEDLRHYGVLEVDGDDRVQNFEEKPLEPTSNLISMGVYVISRLQLIKLLRAVNAEGRYDLVEDVFMRYRKRIRIFGYKFNGYWRTLNSVKSYFECNMDFLNRDVRALFTKQFPFIETKPKDEPPAKYNLGAVVSDCLVGSGAILNGTANHSIMFRKVYTGENSYVNNSIIMEGCYIGNNCVVENAILDKEVVLSDGKQIRGASSEEPYIVSKGTVV